MKESLHLEIYFHVSLNDILIHIQREQHVGSCRSLLATETRTRAFSHTFNFFSFFHFIRITLILSVRTSEYTRTARCGFQETASFFFLVRAIPVLFLAESARSFRGSSCSLGPVTNSDRRNSRQRLIVATKRSQGPCDLAVIGTANSQRRFLKQ